MSSSNLNLAATHNGFALSMSHSNHFNAASVLTYRSNRRSMDRSDNKISDTISASRALPCNDPIQEADAEPRSNLNICLRIIYNTFMSIVIYWGFKRRPNHHSPESFVSRILSMLKFRAIADDSSTYSRSVPTDGIDQSNYIERIDDEHMEIGDQSVNKVTATLIATPPIPIDVATGNILLHF